MAHRRPVPAGLRTLGDTHFGIVVFFGVALCCGLVLADTFQLTNAWSQLRRSFSILIGFVFAVRLPLCADFTVALSGN
jgi:hypothetical protein